MTEPIPCTECSHIVPGPYHCCILCTSRKDALIESLTQEKSELTDQVMGLNRIIKRQLNELSNLIQTDLPFGESK